MDKQETTETEEHITLQDINNTLKDLLKFIDELKFELSLMRSSLF